jgi:hypothetical protein
MYEFKKHEFTSSGHPPTVVANSLFITGCWKTTWTWIEETGRKPNRRKEKRIILTVVLDQGQQKRLRKQRALLCKSSCDVDSRKLTLSVVLDQGQQKRLREQRALLCKPRALLCKPSRDEDSRKLTLAVVLDQGLAKKTQETKGIVMQTRRMYTETEF